MNSPAPEIELLVCIKCRRQTEVPQGGKRPGEILYDQLADDPPAEGLRVRAVECLSNCSQGCSIALRGPGRWTYVYGNFHEALHAETLREGARLYLQTPDGLVPWRDRPEHFRKNCIARIPPLES